MNANWMLRVDGLGKRYGRGCRLCIENTGPGEGTNSCANCGSIVACANVSFDLLPGETLGIVGESGSGKSTALRCLFMDEEPTWGSAYLAGFHNGSETSSPRRCRNAVNCAPRGWASPTRIPRPA